MTHVFPSRSRAIFAVVSMVLVGITLRAPLTSLASVLPDIQETYHLSPTTAGLLTSLPVFCFGLGAVVVSNVARRFGLNRVMVTTLTLLTVLVAIRPFMGTAMLLITTAGTGLMMTAGNVLLPVVVRRDFVGHQGKVMSAVTSSLSGGAALGAALTIPLGVWFGWRWALAAWALVTLAAALTFFLFTGAEDTVEESGSSFAVWKVPGAWAMALFFGLNSGMYYANTHWMPTYLPELTGASDAQMGVAVSIFQFAGLIGAIGVPVLITRVYNRQAYALAIASLWVVYSFGMLLVPSWYFVWVFFGAVAQGGGFALLLTLYVLRAPNLGMVRDLSGMTQTLGYFLSATAPVSVGALFEYTGQWSTGLAFLAAMSVVFLALAPVVASRHRLPDPAA